MSKNSNEDKDWGFVIASIVVSVLIIGLWLLTYCLLKDEGTTERGTFGDMFGSINALFSGLALAGIILTILLQRKELKLQRDELKDTRKEFEIERITTLVFKQLERIDTIISFIPFDSFTGHQISGVSGLRHFNNHLSTDFAITATQPPRQVNLINDYKAKINEVFVIIETSHKIIDQQLSLTGLENEDKKRLVSVFIQNIDPEIYKLSKKTEIILDRFLTSPHSISTKETFRENLKEIQSEAKIINQLIGNQF